VSQLDQWFAASAPDSPLIGQSQFFVDSGLRHGVDPRLLAAIAAHESSFGRSQFDENNVFGWFSGEHYASIAENVEAVATGLRANYLDQGLHSVATIGARYAPVGASNDPTNLNSNWVVGVSRFYGELGGNPEQVP
jgi:hypothetical protein